MDESGNKNSFLKIIVLLVFIAGGSFAFARYYQNSKPCAQPIKYHINSFDNRFDVTRSEFLAAIDEASIIWEKAVNLNLFEYDQSSDHLAINLIYDERQQATDQLENLGDKIETSQQSYHTLKAQYDAAVAEYKRDKAEYDSSVSYWNNRGGAPKDEYNKLVTQQAALNSAVSRINSMAATLNHMAQQLNLNVSRYNDIGESRGDEFEEGVYISDQDGERIEIYEFQNRDQLIRLLAHELGHALGLEHVEDENAIMYRLNSGSNESLTHADLVELNLLCGLTP